MPPKKQPNKKKSKTSSSAGTQVDNELENLVQNADSVATAPPPGAAAAYGKAIALTALMAVYCNASLLALSPVYGAVPAEIKHSYVVWTALFIGWAGNVALRALPVKPALLIPVVAAYIPLAQHYLFKLSDSFGGQWGPAITEALTIGPLVVLSASSVADLLESTDLSSRVPQSVAEAAPGMGSYLVFKVTQAITMRKILQKIGASFILTRMGLESMLTVMYAVMARSKLLILTAPAILHAAFMNPHVITPMSTGSLNSTLSHHGWSVVDRWESNTGYISVLDNHNEGIRVLRCDHSLLGGEWTRFPKVRVGEPIYSVFTQLEAVRLVENANKPQDHEAKALNIGLGIGTTPSALVAHGIDTTVVELDPVVYRFAEQYFGLPTNHTAVVADAVKWTKANRESQAEAYDYIIHDVFTGGAEPIDLFTDEFLQGLAAMLKPSGVIAINFAGDFKLPPLSIVANTVRSVFPSCRFFRESPAPTDPEAVDHDFDNVIMFCTKSAQPIAFREPTEADFLHSIARRSYLLPKHEVPSSAFLQGDKIGILHKDGAKKLAKWHKQSALNHWEVMREVVPSFAWENW